VAAGNSYFERRLDQERASTDGRNVSLCLFLDAVKFWNSVPESACDRAPDAPGGRRAPDAR
jgi:hypothetical protein